MNTQKEQWGGQIEAQVKQLFLAVEMRARAITTYEKDHEMAVKGEMPGYLGSSVTVQSLQDHDYEVNKQYEKLISLCKELLASQRETLAVSLELGGEFVDLEGDFRPGARLKLIQSLTDAAAHIRKQ